MKGKQSSIYINIAVISQYVCPPFSVREKHSNEFGSLMPLPLILSMSNTAGMNSVVSMPDLCILSVSNMSMSNITEDILSVSKTYTNVATLPLSLVEQGGTLAPLKF